MAMHVPRVRVVRHASDLGNWEMVNGDPDPRLAPYVREYCGFVESTPGPMRRREFPSAQVVLIIDFGPTLRILDPRQETVVARHRAGFVAGLHDSFALTETPGSSSGVQVNFTPLGARRFFGLPMEELACRVVGLEDVLGAEGRLLTERLQDAPGWEERFSLLDEYLAARLTAARGVPEWVAWAFRRIEESGGLVEVGTLADSLGFSHRHLIARFREHVGLPPKLLARIVRFERLLEQVKSGGRPAWGELALEHGYYDQAHLIRDFRQFTGSSPREFLLRQLPDNGGVSGG
ncbi:AraC family transcriptional regulator [Archangium violaceum]|uniref:helix-turn-helix domain-containing protein n=1 Tax=Archangium violaceum TaxID=83451 RepID=UPI00193B2BA4|nr:helix-turn-helix domain-containing protein [Archangium violaceum]QRK11256.1 AraC family transcriptional regulator [Archangium violaceum]